MDYIKGLSEKLKGLSRLAYVLYRDIERLKLSREAAALTYTSILALVPSLIVVFSILSILASYYNQIAHLNNLMKEFLFSFLTLSSAKGSPPTG